MILAILAEFVEPAALVETTTIVLYTVFAARLIKVAGLDVIVEGEVENAVPPRVIVKDVAPLLDTQLT